MSAQQLLDRADRVTVLTGAGVSTDSGIPDYRGANGLWRTNPESVRLVNFGAYQSDAALRAESWRRRVQHPAWTARPNAAHHALASLYDQGRLRCLLTQNVDGLHQQAGLPAEVVVELHGTIRDTECLQCSDRRPMRDALARVRAGETDPACLTCGGILKSATVFFGQPLDADLLARAVTAAGDCDAFLVAGSSLTVQPVAGLVLVAVRAGIPVVIVNADPTPYDRVAAEVIRQPIGAILPELLRCRTDAADRSANSAYF
jgi:NAD-dependent deacetylase